MNQKADPQIAPPLKAPSEKAQIVVHFLHRNELVLRFRKLKDAQKLFDRIAPLVQKDTTYLCKTDMFDSSINFLYVAAVSLVDHDKRDKFVPV